MLPSVCLEFTAILSIASMTPVEYGMAGIGGGISSGVGRTFPVCNGPQPGFADV
jgi:hypothetical protein